MSILFFYVMPSMRPRPFLQGSYLQSSPNISSNFGKAAEYMRAASRKCLDLFGLGLKRMEKDGKGTNMTRTFWSPFRFTVDPS